MNCDDSADIAGAITAQYPVAANGSYAVKVTQGNCTEWSDCIAITTIGLEEHTSNWTIYPNPTSGEFFIVNAPTIREVAIYDLNGRLLETLPVTEGRVELPESIARGVYIVRNLGSGRSALISVQ